VTFAKVFPLGTDHDVPEVNTTTVEKPPEGVAHVGAPEPALTKT
jgi:hypothetical protein